MRAGTTQLQNWVTGYQFFKHPSLKQCFGRKSSGISGGPAAYAITAHIPVHKRLSTTDASLSSSFLSNQASNFLLRVVTDDDYKAL